MKKTISDVLDKITVKPRRDWRFWAAIAALGGLIIVGVAFFSVDNASDQKDVQIAELRSQVEELKTQNAILIENQEVGAAQAECRTSASLFTAEQRAIADSLFNRGLSAFAEGTDLAPYTAALNIANNNVDVAIAAQKVAIDECNQNPEHQIDPSILAPVPTIPGGNP